MPATPRLRNGGRALLLVAACCTLPACNYAWVARDRFVADYTCPADRVVVVRRSDIRGSSIVLPAASPPPPEVASDPARLQLWNRQHEQARKANDSFQVFDVKGCGHSARYACLALGGDTPYTGCEVDSANKR